MSRSVTTTVPYGASVDHTGIDRSDVLNHPVGVEPPPSAFGAPPTTRLTKVAILQETDDCHRQGLRVANRDQQPRFSVVDDFRETAGSGGDDGAATGHRVERRRAESLGDRAHHVEVECLVPLFP